MDEILFARQSIYDKKLNVVAYELLYRSDENNRAIIDSHFLTQALASASVFINSIVELGLDKIAYGHPVHIKINVHLAKSLEFIPLNYPVVFDLILDEPIDDALLEKLKHLKDKNFKLAINDYYRLEKQEFLKIEPVIDIIKVDMLAKKKREMLSELEKLGDFKGDILIKKIEDKNLFGLVRETNASLFQGFFMSFPNKVRGRKTSPGKLALLQLMAKVQDSGVSFEEISEAIAHDLKISYKLLRIVNSAKYNNSGREITSLNEAVVRLGIDTVKFWINIIALSGMGDDSIDLLNQSLTRAYMCKNLALLLGLDDSRQQTYFTLGLLSLIDVALNDDLEKILKDLPLSDELNLAILQKSGILGSLLTNVINYERGKFIAVKDVHLSKEQYKNAYLNSIMLADEVTRYLI